MPEEEPKNNRFDTIFYPKSIAVVGASNDKNKIGGYIFSEILKVEEIEAYPINLKEEKVQEKKAFPRLSAIGKEVDLTIIAVPSSFVLQVMEDCVSSKCKNIVIISAGFKETGKEGKEREDKLKEMIKENNLNVIGPNCLGFLNPEKGLNCSFAKDTPEAGDIALISQSGAVIDAIIDWSFQHKIGFSKIVSLGNMAGVDELAMLSYLKDDEKTKAIFFYMETLEKGRLFGEILKDVSKKKPVVIIKPGTSDNAKKAIGSHTGSLAQDNVLVETLITDNNGIIVESLNELFNIMIAIQAKKFSSKNKLAIVTNAGGPGVIATDYVAKTGFELVEFTDEEKKKFELPKEASVNNPIDILGDAKSDRYKNAIEKLETISSVENILVLLTPQIMTDSEEIAKVLTEKTGGSMKNIFSSFLGGKEIKKALDHFDEKKFANFQTPSDALAAMDKLLRYKQYNYQEKIPSYPFDEERIKKIRHKLKGREGMLDFSLTKEVMDVFAIRVPEKKIIREAEDVEKIEHELDDEKKYILKVDSKEIIHKKDVGGVVNNISKENLPIEVAKLVERVSKITEKFTITLEEQYEGTEVIIGLKKDKELGPFIMFGMGGTYVNVMKDVNFSSCPLNKKRAQEIVERSKIYTLLKGYRGSGPINFNDLYEILMRLSFMHEIFPEIDEVDLNPILCSEKGLFLVDVKLILPPLQDKSAEKAESSKEDTKK